jgi:hypothetical protein
MENGGESERHRDVAVARAEGGPFEERVKHQARKTNHEREVIGVGLQRAGRSLEHRRNEETQPQHDDRHKALCVPSMGKYLPCDERGDGDVHESVYESYSGGAVVEPTVDDRAEDRRRKGGYQVEHGV